MSEPFLAELKIMSFNFAPKGWATCNGALLPINQNQALFALLGTTYGGNGQTTFALPDLRDRVPLHFGGSHTLGEVGGENSSTLSIAQIPTHRHVLTASSAQGNAPVPNGPAGNLLASTTPALTYAQPANLVATNAGSVANVGGSQAHENRQPFLTLLFCIALQGIFPSRN